MLGLGRAVDEVPLLQRPLLSLDDEERLPREDEERLRLGLPVVRRVRLARLEYGQIDAQHREERVGFPLGLAGEAHALPAGAGVPPRVARVQDEPARGGRDESGVRLLQLGLGDVHAECLADREGADSVARELRLSSTSSRSPPPGLIPVPTSGGGWSIARASARAKAGGRCGAGPSARRCWRS